MALFRRSQNDSIIQNQFWELPDHYWIGTMLVNKHTMLPVGGYDTPLVSVGYLALRGKDAVANGFTDLTAIPTDSTHFYTSYNNGDYFKTFCMGATMGQCGFMAQNYFPMRFVSPTNNQDEMPQAYVKDPVDPDIVYTQFNGDSIGDSTFLVKYNTRTHKVIWCRKNLGSEAFVRMNIFSIQDGVLYILACGAGIPSYPGTQSTVITGTVGSTAMNKTIYTYPYHGTAYWCIVRVSAETGDVIGQAAYEASGNVNSGAYQRNPGDAHDCQWVGLDAQGRDVFLMSKFGIANFLTSNTTTSTSNPTVSYSIFYFLYDRVTHTATRVPGTYFNHTNTAWSTVFYITPSDYSMLTVLPKPSRPDRTITDSITCYGFGGSFIRYNNSPTNTEACRIYKYVFDGETQSWKPMTALSKEGSELTGADWWQLIHQFTMLKVAKFYILYGSDNTKFLMVHVTPISSSSKSAVATNDAYGATLVFKFLDEDTVQLVDNVEISCTDLLWLQHNVFVAARYNRIRIYSVNLTTGKISLLKNLIPASSTNEFSYVYVDDMSNLWFMETGIDSSNPVMRQSSLYFVNSFTVSRMVLDPEHSTYVFSGTEIESYVDIQAIGDLGDIIERDVRLTAVGPIKFKATGGKVVLTKTSPTGLARVPFIITGVGDASITMSLTTD